MSVVQGEVEIKDGDASSTSVHIEIEKSGPSESHTEGVVVNQTTFDVGHGSVFMLQLVSKIQWSGFCYVYNATFVIFSQSSKKNYKHSNGA